MNFWNRELVTDLDYVWDFVDNVSPLPSYSTFIRKGSFFKQGRNKHIRGQIPHRRSRIGTLMTFTSTDLGVESLTPLFYGLR